MRKSGADWYFLISGAQPLESFARAIEEERARAQ
jgi:hypothetical protein